MMVMMLFGVLPFPSSTLLLLILLLLLLSLVKMDAGASFWDEMSILPDDGAGAGGGQEVRGGK